MLPVTLVTSATSSVALKSSHPPHWILTAFLIAALLRSKTTYLILPTPPWLAHLPFQPAMNQVFFTYTFTSSSHILAVFLDLCTLEDEVSVFLQNIRNWLPSDMASYPRIMQYSTTLLAGFKTWNLSIVTTVWWKFLIRYLGDLKKLTKYEIFMNL